MILVILGTQNNKFDRLLNEVQKCIDNGIIQDEVIAQVGFTNFQSNQMKIFEVIEMKKFNDLINEANLIITHGGTGSIINGIKLGKKIIAVPRLKQYNEHVNNHQLQIVENFDKQGYIKGVFNIEDLGKVIQDINNFVPNKFISNSGNIIKLVEDYIENY